MKVDFFGKGKKDRKRRKQEDFDLDTMFEELEIKLPSC